MSQKDSGSLVLEGRNYNRRTGLTGFRDRVYKKGKF